MIITKVLLQVPKNIRGSMNTNLMKMIMGKIMRRKRITYSQAVIGQPVAKDILRPDRP
jgi:hypothetical protein